MRLRKVGTPSLPSLPSALNQHAGATGGEQYHLRPTPQLPQELCRLTSQQPEFPFCRAPQRSSSL